MNSQKDEEYEPSASAGVSLVKDLLCHCPGPRAPLKEKKSIPKKLSKTGSKREFCWSGALRRGEVSGGGPRWRKGKSEKP